MDYSEYLICQIQSLKFTFHQHKCKIIYLDFPKNLLIFLNTSKLAAADVKWALSKAVNSSNCPTVIVVRHPLNCKNYHKRRHIQLKYSLQYPQAWRQELG